MLPTISRNVPRHVQYTYFMMACFVPSLIPAIITFMFSEPLPKIFWFGLSMIVYYFVQKDMGELAMRRYKSYPEWDMGRFLSKRPSPTLKYIGILLMYHAQDYVQTGRWREVPPWVVEELKKRRYL